MTRGMKRLPLLETALSLLAPVPAVLVAAAILFPGAAAADPAKAQVTLTVTGIKDHKGALMIAVYDQAGYTTDKSVAASMVPVSADTATTTFELPAGAYGIKLFHDVDGDGKMGTNPFGMPTEPFAFSNNAHGNMGPAPWSAAAFTVDASGATQTLVLK